MTAALCLRYAAPAGGLWLPLPLGLEKVPRGTAGQENADRLALGSCLPTHSPNSKGAPYHSNSTHMRPGSMPAGGLTDRTPVHSGAWGLLGREAIQMGFLFPPPRKGWEPTRSLAGMGA